MEDENTEHIDTEHIDEVFVDTNVLVYLRQKQSPFQEASRQRLNDLEKGEVGRWISRQIVREYLAAMTRITDLSTPLLLEDARRFRVADEGADVTERLLGLLERVEVGGKQVHDANIAATMIEHGVEHILTHNAKDFTRFEDSITVMPLIP